MIELSECSKSFGKNVVLRNVGFQIAKGERVSIVGPGGCGKTLVLKIILGLESCDKGRATLMGADLHEYSDPDILKRVGVAFQQGALFDFMSVRENIFFAMENMTGMALAEMESELKSKLETVKLTSSEKLYPHQLSGGMIRRIGIARALCTNPEVAMFDEPTAGLDPVTSSIILKMIHDLGAGGGEKTLLVATSNTEIAVRFSERIIVINQGEIAADGLWKDLLVNGPEWVRYFLGSRFIGLDIDYARELELPEEFIRLHW